MASKILIADDTMTVLDYLELVFEKEGFEIIRAGSGRQAIEKAKEQKPDLLLVDVMMPDVDGFDVCRALRSDPATSHLPILLYSAVVGEEVRARARAAGADEFLGKSLHHAELVNRVRDWLASRSLPGGIGEPEMVEVAADLLSLLEVELVWVLGEQEQGYFVTLAIACERGEQEALRFASRIGAGPHQEQPSSVLGAVMSRGPVRPDWPLEEVARLEGGDSLAKAMASLGASSLIAASLHPHESLRGALLATAAPTLSRSKGEAKRLAAALRYLNLALARWAEGVVDDKRS